MTPPCVQSDNKQQQVINYTYVGSIYQQFFIVWITFGIVSRLMQLLLQRYMHFYEKKRIVILNIFCGNLWKLFVKFSKTKVLEYLFIKFIGRFLGDFDFFFENCSIAIFHR